MRRRLAGLVIAGTLLGVPGPAFADHYGGDEYGGGDYENDYGSEGDNSRGRDRGAFSPGPFTDSPVTIWICAVPDSCPQNPPAAEE